MITKEIKFAIIKNNQIHLKDTGSVLVQIELLGARIRELKEHFNKHTKDLHSRRGMLMMANKRRKLIRYMKRKNPEYSFQSRGAKTHDSTR